MAHFILIILTISLLLPSGHLCNKDFLGFVYLFEKAVYDLEPILN